MGVGTQVESEKAPDIDEERGEEGTVRTSHVVSEGQGEGCSLSENNSEDGSVG